jgi:hypothetical protein
MYEILSNNNGVKYFVGLKSMYHRYIFIYNNI